MKLIQYRYFSADNKLQLALIMLSCIFIILVSTFLEPSGAGYGTHKNLWLPPCMFNLLFNLPCPFCGILTSMAYMGKLQLKQACLTQPLGILVFFVAILVLLYISLATILKIKLMFTAGERRMAAFILLGIVACAWVYKILTF